MPAAVPAPIRVFASLVDHLPLGVVVMDRSGSVVLYNRYEEILAARKRENVLGRDFFHEIAPCMNVRELGGAFREQIGRREIDVEVEFAFPLPFLEQPRDVVVQMTSFASDGDVFGCLFIEDVSAERAVSRMKDTLSSLLVHDLKNPLTVALSNLQLLRELPHVRDDEDALELATSAIDASRRLERMVVTLLDITRLETNSLPLTKRTVDATALVRAAVEDAQATARLYDLEVILDGRTPVEVEIDPDLTRRAVDNLLDNAIRYAKSRVIARVAETQRGLRIEIEDDGPGISDAERDRIFDMYGRATGAGGRRSEGNRGLGLTFVRLMARSHGGDVAVERAGAEGSVFSIDLPSPGATR